MNVLRAKLIQLDHPVGTKKVSNWKLPPNDFAYGARIRKDQEGVSEITRSWIVHKLSITSQPPQDFIKINKLAVKMNANNYSTNKDFREHIDIRQKMKEGSREHQIKLPSKDFAYGIHNRAPTPVKEVINFDYGNNAEKEIRKDYLTYLNQKKKFSQSVPKTTRHYEKIVKLRTEEKKVTEKPLYKMKMFQNIGSKVTEKVKQFKSNHHTIPQSSPNKSSIDMVIDKVQKEIEETERRKLNNNMPNASS